MLEPVVQLFFYLVDKIGPWGVFFGLFFIPAMLIGTGDSIRENRDYRRAMKRAEEEKRAAEMQDEIANEPSLQDSEHNTPNPSANVEEEKRTHQSGPFTSPFAPAPKQGRSSNTEVHTAHNVVPFRERNSN